MAWSQGIDCWGHDDNRSLKAAEYVAKYNLGHDVPFTEYTWQSGPSSTPPHVGWQTHTEISGTARSEEHTSELQSRGHLVCRLLLEKKKKYAKFTTIISKQTTSNTRTTITYHRTIHQLEPLRTI